MSAAHPLKCNDAEFWRSFFLFLRLGGKRRRNSGGYQRGKFLGFSLFCRLLCRDLRKPQLLRRFRRACSLGGFFGGYTLALLFSFM